LQFHHKNREEKSYELSKKLSSYSFEKLKSEADKCVLVCSTCHAEIEGGVTKCPN
jgi:Fe-S oxidoreductase